jgi:hypothetical protein
VCSIHERQKLTASDAAQEDGFGYSVSISGNWGIIGAPYDDDAGDGSGSVYVFRRDDNGTPLAPGDDFWVQEDKLLPSDGGSEDAFGHSVSINGERVIIGAHGDNDVGSDSGSAYVFRRDDSGTPLDPSDDVWVQEDKLTASDGNTSDAFGFAVSISGERVIIGAFRDDDACPGDPDCDSGSAYVFRRYDNGTPFDQTDDLWIEEAKLLPSDGSAVDRFGFSVSISGSRAVVGATGNDDAGDWTGSAYVFRVDDDGTPLDPADDLWIEEAKLTGSDACALNWFGMSVSISADHALVGAVGDDDACPSDLNCNSGSAYVFRVDDYGTPLDPSDDFWVEVQKLTALDAANRDLFGTSVSTDGDRAVIGARWDRDLGYLSGSAYVYRREDNGTAFDPSDDFWVHQAKHVASDADPHDEFGDVLGWSAAISGDRAMVGALLDDDAGENSGSVYIFAVRADGTVDCNCNLIADTVDIAEGTSEDCSGNDIPDECEPDCNENSVADSCDVVDGTSEDCNANGIPDECEPDCNENSVADSCDISDSTSEDCTGNNIPDECEADCNKNSIADSCDIADGTSEDLDGDGVPDECVEIQWRPVAADGYVVCLPGEDPCGETEIMLSGGEVTVTLFLELSGWDRDQDGDPLLGAYQGTVDATTYSGGLAQGEVPTHPGNPGTVEGLDLSPVGPGYEAAFMALEVCGPMACYWDPTGAHCEASWDRLSDCGTNPNSTACPDELPACVDRPDYVFSGLEHVAIVSTARPDYSWAGASAYCAYDDGTFKYGGTLLLEVPAGATGTYNVGFVDSYDYTMMNTCAGPLIWRVKARYGQITIVKGRCCSNIGVGTTMCEDDLSQPECDARPGLSQFAALESCSGAEVADCNDNGVPDECEILAADCNDNGIPDDCEPDDDGDGVINVCDGCPDDPNKTEPGICGCGLDDNADSDGDGVPDCFDECPGVDDALFAPSCVDAIPTVSTWGLGVLTLLLLAAGKVCFTRRRDAAA